MHRSTAVGEEMVADLDVFAGLTVIDRGLGMPQALVAKFMADYGARVVRLLPVGGDPFESIYPAYAVWHGKSEKVDSARLSAADLDKLLVQADVYLVGGEDYPDIPRSSDAATLISRHPRLIVLDIQAAPAGGPGSDGPAVDILAQADSGLAFEQYSGRPLLMAFQPGNFGAALQGILGICTALYERTSSGCGQLVETSLFEGALMWLGMFWARIEKRSRATDAVMPKDPYPTIFRCADGEYIHFVTGSAGSKYLTFQALGIDDPSVKPGDSGLPDMSDPKKFFGPVDLYAEHCAKLTSLEILKRMWAHGLPVNPVRKPGGCWDERQIEIAGIIERDSVGRRHVGRPFRIQGRAGAAVAESSRDPRSSAKKGALPLSGVRVVDFGAFVAGPLASAVLADLGADVIKVEPLAGDPCRRAPFRSFSSANRGKRSLVLDLKNPEALALTGALLKTADAVTSNFRPGASARLGIDPPSLQRLRPDQVVLESPAYGAGGPMSERAGFDMIMQALCGHEHRAGGTGNEPLWNRTGMVDTAAGLLGAISVVAGLFHRARTGQGSVIESALVCSGVFLLSELIEESDGTLLGAEPVNRSRTGYRPSEALYQTRDGWIAIAARGEDAARRLAGALGLAAALAAPAQSWGALEEAKIAAAVALMSSAEVLALLGQAKVWAAECRRDRENEVMSDARMESLGTVRASVHPQFGAVHELSTMPRFSRCRTGNARAAPLLGESTGEILAELGCEHSRIADLITRHVAA